MTPLGNSAVASIRLPGDVAAALRTRAGETGETVSDLMRQGALMLLGVCPTCGRPAPVQGETEAT